MSIEPLAGVQVRAKASHSARIGSRFVRMNSASRMALRGEDNGWLLRHFRGHRDRPQAGPCVQAATGALGAKENQRVGRERLASFTARTTSAMSFSSPRISYTDSSFLTTS